MTGPHLRRWLGRTFMLLPLIVAACGDGLGPEPRGAAVRIYLGGVVYDEQTIAVGQRLQLEAQILDAAGDQVSGQTVEWRSDKPEVASVDDAGVVLGQAVGTARIIARHQVGEDTAWINVALPVTGTLECASGGPAFGVGESRILSGPETTAICLPGGSDGSEYSLVVVNTGSTAASRLQTRVQASGVTFVPGGPTPLLFPKPEHTFHHTIRHEISARLEPRLRSGIDPADLAAVTRQVELNDVLPFNVETTSADGCTSPDIRGGRVRAISNHAIVVADTLNPAGGFDAADYASFGEFFDDEVWPLVTSAFGTPSDIDRNQKVYLFFTRGVNERPENSTTSQGIFVGGFFFNRDLFPKSGKNSCAGSNVAEMFYMLVPDPTGEVQGRRFSRAFVERNTRSVLVHEFQHLVNDSRRLHVNSAPVWEETWLNEGLSHIAEELMFYRLSGLQPRRNLGPDSFTSSQARQAFEIFQLANVERLSSFLRAPETSSLMGADVLATRGAAWHFLRYAADQKNAESEFWRALVKDTRTSGLANLEQALGEDPAPWVRDWAAAVYLDDSGQDVAPRFRFPSWNFRLLYPAAKKLWYSLYYDAYPLRVMRLGEEAGGQELQLAGGSPAYFRTGVAAGEAGAVRITVGDLPAPSRLRVVLTRVR